MVRKAINKTGASARVTFDLPAMVGAHSVHLCGDFNDWSQDSHPLKQRKDGGFSVTVSLPTGRSYRYRFLVDGERWENDWEADAYVPNEFGTEDSVVEL